jgi:tetratricopeptide (TPR) repeat protein
MADDALTDTARRVLELVSVNPAQAWREANELIRRAERARDHAAASVATRAAGLAALHMTNLDTAIDLLRSAVDHARRAADSARLIGEARMTLAFVYNRRGDVRRALRTIDAAVGGLTGVERARAVAQRGAIRQQLGRLDEALADYRAALPNLRRHEDWLWVQRIHLNRGVLNIYRSQLTAAAADLAESEQVCHDHGLDLQLAFVYENNAFLHLRRGDVPAALHWLDAAERERITLQAQAGTVLMDRSELLLSVGLVAEARTAAARAVEMLGKSRWGISLPQAQLLLAETALLDDDVPAAEAAATAAARAFRAQDRPAWLALARYTSLRCRLRRPGNRVRIHDLTRAAADLETAGWAVPAMDARLIAAGMALDKQDTVGAAELLGPVRSARRRGPAELRARAWHAEALRRLADGRGRSAAAALQAGIRVLEDHQATLPAADLRSIVSSHRADLVALGTRLALHSGRAAQALLWAERGRATALRVRPLRPPDDPVVAQLLVQLRAVVFEIDEARTAKRPHDGLIARQSSLERAVRDQVRATSGPTTATRRPSVEQISAALSDAALIEYVEQDGTLFAVTVVGRHVRLTPLGITTGLPSLLQQLPFALRRLARRSPTGRDDGAGAALQLLRRACQELDDLLLAPLARELGDRPLVIVPNGLLRSVLWSALPSCAARPVTVAPSAAHWYQAEHTRSRPGQVVIAAGPDLAAAPAEATAVAKLYDNAQVLVGPDATVNAVKAALRDSSVAHIAAHGRLRSDNPQFSSLRMFDGPLTVYDLDTVGEAPGLVVLAACDGGNSHTLFGDEILGLSAGFLAHGTAALVGPLGLVRDGAMEDLMVELHRGLRQGRSPADALVGVREMARDGSPAVQAAAASLVCLGAGH